MARVRIRTNWTNRASKAYEFELDDLADASVRGRLKCACSEPEHFRPGQARQALSECATASFAVLAKGLRPRGHHPQIVTQFVNRLIFCMFAEDVSLLPNEMFIRMLEHARRRPEDFRELVKELLRAMAPGRRFGFDPVPRVQRPLVARRLRAGPEHSRQRDWDGGHRPRLVGNRPLDSGQAL